MHARGGLVLPSYFALLKASHFLQVSRDIRLDARGCPARRVSGGLERLSGDRSGRRGHLYPFIPPAPAGSRLAARAARGRVCRRLREVQQEARGDAESRVDVHAQEPGYIIVLT